MKKHLLPILILLGLLACTQTTIEKPTDQKIEQQIDEESALEKAYVNAPSGLNYRDAPSGKILGKFEHNKELTIVKRTAILEKITDDNQTLEGEWVEIAMGEYIVYVFDAFLSPTKNNSIKKPNSSNTNSVNAAVNNNIRPREVVKIDKIYIDTIRFLAYNDDYDHFYFEGKKDDRLVSLIYGWDWNSEGYDFQKNDLIRVEWKVDTLFIAGDDETIISLTEIAIDAKKIIDF